MCGIAGIIHLDHRPVDGDELRQFTRTLTHRGPDGEGYHLRGCIGLGHRRLAILDPSDAGRQPMSDPGGRYWITYNGEIYNFIELRQELLALGHRFQTETDTEVILASFVQWGEGCQFKFNGMWAFAIWDETQRSLFLSRDRFGVKPLHYCYDGRRFAFASEMKAFLALAGFSCEFDSHAIATTLQSPGVLEATDHCLLHGINRLPAGHSLTLSHGKPPVTRRWWRTLDHLRPPPARLADQAAQFRDLFLDACRIRMRSDVPLATSLSGGLDSSAVLCGMTHIRGQAGRADRLARDWHRAFVATYPGTFQDESAYAKIVVEHTGATAIYVEINLGAIADELDDYLYRYEEIQDVHLGPYLVYKAMRDAGVVVSLDGHGGDELLAGYAAYPLEAMRTALLHRLDPKRACAMNRILQAMTPDNSAAGQSNWGAHLCRRFYGPARRTLRNWLQLSPALFRRIRQAGPPTWLEEIPLPIPPLTDAMPPGYDTVNQHLYRDFHYSVLPAILRNFDRLSMSHGVEVRAPFLDWRLVCYSFSLPGESKLGNGYTKQVLREALRGILPEPIRTRTTKVGFGNPLFIWVMDALRPMILETVHSRMFLDSAIWNGQAIRTDVERAYRNGNAALLVRVWPYVLAARFIHSFQHHRCQL